MNLARLGLKAKIIGEGLGVTILTVGRTFYRHVISSSLAQRGVWRGAAETSDSGGV